MKVSRYQWVGLLAGFPLFSGSWLAAYYNNEWVGVLGVLAMGIALWVAVKVERRSSAVEHMKRGAVAGLLAGLFARAIGVIVAMLSDDWDLTSRYANYSSINDMFRTVLNGGVFASLVLVVACCVLGLMVSWFEPAVEQKNTNSKRSK